MLHNCQAEAEGAKKRTTARYKEYEDGGEGDKKKDKERAKRDKVRALEEKDDSADKDKKEV